MRRPHCHCSTALRGRYMFALDNFKAKLHPVLVNFDTRKTEIAYLFFAGRGDPLVELVNSTTLNN
jgi:hypothetical protein